MFVGFLFGGIGFLPEFLRLPPPRCLPRIGSEVFVIYFDFLLDKSNIALYYGINQAKG
jgi:hypothetical protein